MTKVKVAAGDLAKAMKLAAQVVEKRNTIPILSNVLIECEGDCLTVTATDLDLQFRQDVPASTEGKLVVTVPADKLATIASTLARDASLTLAPQTGDPRLVLTSGRSRWVVPTLPRDDFPVIPTAAMVAQVTVAAGDLAALINRVLPFASTEPTRHYLNGPLWHGEAGKIALASTDGHRLMRVPLDIDWPEDAPEVILAPKACRVLAALGEESGEVRLGWNDRSISASIGRTTIIAKVIDGTFPDYRRVIGIAVDAPLRADPGDVSGAISRLLVAGDQKTNAVLIDPADDGVTLSMSSSDDCSTASEEVPCEVGEMPATAFNAKYLQQILAALGGDAVEFHMADPGAPMRLVRTVDDGAIATVMPMRR